MAEYNPQKFEVAYEDCVKLIRKSKRVSFFISFRWLAPSKDQSDAKDGFVKGIDVSGYVRLSRRELLRCLDNAYNEHARATCYVRVTLHDTCFFVGGAW